MLIGNKHQKGGFLKEITIRCSKEVQRTQIDFPTGWSREDGAVFFQMIEIRILLDK